MDGDNVEANPSTVGNRLVETLFSEAVIVGGLTLLGYVVAYGYLIGEADALGIPLRLVSVSLENVLPVVLILILLSGPALIWGEILADIWHEGAALVLKRRVSREITMLVSWFVVGVAGGALITPIFYVVMAMAAFGLLIILVPPLIWRSQGGRYIDRLEAKSETAARIAPGKSRFGKRFATWAGGRAVLLLVLCFLSIAAATFMGSAFARQATYYFASLDQPSEILLVRYGDLLIFRPEGTAEITIRVIGKDDIPRLVRKQIGSMALPDR